MTTKGSICLVCEKGKKNDQNSLCESCLDNKRDAKYFKIFLGSVLLLSVLITMVIEYKDSIGSFLLLITDLTPDIFKTFLSVLFIVAIVGLVLFILFMSLVYQDQGGV